MFVFVDDVGSMSVDILPARLVRFSLSGWFVMKVDQLGVNMVGCMLLLLVV